MILIGLIFLFGVCIRFLFIKKFIPKKILLPISTLILGLAIIFFVSRNSINIVNNSELYSNPNRPIPLSINIVEGSRVSYKYNKNYIKKGYDNGQRYFTLKPLNIKSSTNFVVKQKYRNDFLVPTVKVSNIKIIINR